MQHRPAPRLALTFALAALVAFAPACGDDDGGGSPSPDGGPVGQADCVPSESAWNDGVAALVAERCGGCHAATPQFGAPFPLLDYATLVEGAEGTRIVDFMAFQVGEGLMPPIGARSLPSLAERDTITSWASCGDVRVETPVGLETNRPPFVAPVEPPAGLRTIDLTLEGFAVGPTVIDHYQERDFTALVEEDVFIRRMDAIIDDSRVVHHITLRQGDPDGSDASMTYLYTWAPGTGAFEFPDGGIRLRRGDNLRLQVHYNNGSGATDVRDSSGVRLYVGAVSGAEYTMADPGPGAFGFSVAPRSDGTVESTCMVREPVTVIATMPHMHEIGDTFDIDVTRAGTTTNVLRLGAWSFETQLFYELPLVLEAGDRLTVRCTFANPRNEVVQAGARTEDEMCFAFTYVTPAIADFCGPAASSALAYRPGACFHAPRAADPITPEVSATAPSFAPGASMPEGHWSAARAVLVTPSPALVSAATFTLAGQMSFASGELQIDAGIHVIAPTAELRDGRQFDLSFAGSLDVPMGESTLSAQCGGVAPGTTVGMVEGRPAMRIPLDVGIELALWVMFE